ncbi:uncharacterized protein DUF4890 [Algoriphagus ratkowskyi]|uniref:DUF4890 domain-containing protein n=1 Tax=Algoriphagus ratkowskyi TaxID=57028 RepID=A0A2W7RIM6_9BACT|nr:DUF4890 domain-containing protein [Algoriphagus ratkowskyi]PZX58270.1 uncharacterized protein DUF4890 [Algoriphagus ratkowskyi]TXD77851.1 DUF4890 domain-containing protein [Algoriphagus ratkowskyi]
MKKWIYATGLMMMISASTFAQKKGGERPSAEEIATRNTEKMAEQLALTDTQKQQVLDINLEFAKKNEAERKAEMEARKAEMEARKAKSKEQDNKIQSVLTEEQRAKWTELKAEKINDHRKGRPNAQIETDPRKGRKSREN